MYSEKKIIWSYESRFSLFVIFDRIYIFKILAKINDPNLLQTRADVWWVFSYARKPILWYSTGTIIILQDLLESNDYVKIFNDQVHPMVQTLFFNDDVVYQG